MMKTISIFTLKALRKLYSKCSGSKNFPKPECDQDPDSAAQTIFNALMSDKPCMIARFGSTEMACLVNYIGVKNHQNRIFDYVKGLSQPWWWEPNIINQMQQWSGFFPARADKIEQFCELMMKDIPEVDVLGSWLPEERYFENQLINVNKVRFTLLDPYWALHPWSKALEGKKVVVVHPFAKTIEGQYKKRELLFNNSILPEFELKTVKAVQSIAGATTTFTDWFEALDHMKAEIDNHDYDICIIGAGAYGFPLAAHVKRMGKKGFHIGGSLQLLFGIRGKRWENENYSYDYNYTNLINEYWVKPCEHERPANAAKVENACYW
jgi:hypothetical protein